MAEGLPEYLEIERDSEDDSPMEVSSKLQQPKISGTESDAYLKDKKLQRKKKRRKKQKVVKVKEGVYQTETKSSTIKVVPLSVPPQPPTRNFRARLLQKRTQDQRVTKAEHAGLQHRAKWFAVTKQR